MMKIALMALGVAAVVGGIAFALMPQETTPKQQDGKSLYDFTMKNIKGESVKLDQYKGKAVLIVNVASQCGNTPQYAGLEALYDKYKEKGLVVLGFPCNQFNGQEPGSDAEILEFCQTKYDVSFPMFSKIDVKGEQADPLYQWLVHSTENRKDVEWNFAKFLVGKDGTTVTRFGARTKPESQEIVAAIETALN